LLEMCVHCHKQNRYFGVGWEVVSAWGYNTGCFFYLTEHGSFIT